MLAEQFASRWTRPNQAALWGQSVVAWQPEAALRPLEQLGLNELDLEV